MAIEILNAPEALESSFSKLDFPDSLSFLAFFNPHVKHQTIDASGKPFLLHKWQCEENEDISYGRVRNYKTGEILKQFRPTAQHPYKKAICAANGSGKDAFIIAPLALWFCCCKIQSKTIITSASGAQLNTQTEVYIKDLAKHVNAWTMQRFGHEILKINQRHIYCSLTDSHIYMFATDEGEKAEGHHPTTPSSEMMIIVNEAKSVSEEIFDALRRCTGYNYLIYISSPGEPRGTFYKACITWPTFRRVSYFDCPHQAPEEFEQDRNELGEFSFLFRSKWLALFTYIGGNYVISKGHLDNLRDQIKQGHVKWLKRNLPKRIGIDIALSGNGDETAISVWQGNKEIDKREFKFQNAVQLANAIEEFLLKHVPKNHHHIFADDGGVGRAVIDMLNERGWKIIRVLNNSTATKKRQYRNRGAQLWYKFARLVEKNLIILIDDDTSYQQLASRKYKTSDANATTDKLQLQSKREMIAQGLNSPDRADAKILALTDIGISEFAEAEKVEVSQQDQHFGDIKPNTIMEIRNLLRRNKMKHFQDRAKRKPCGLSMSVVLNTIALEETYHDTFSRVSLPRN